MAALPIVQSHSEVTVDNRGLDHHRKIALPTAYRWTPQVLSFHIDDDLYLYEAFDEELVRLANVLKLSAPWCIDDARLLEKLETRGLVTKKSEAEARITFRERIREKQRRQHVLKYTVAPTLRCNFACNYCFEELNRTDLSAEDAEFLVENMARRAKEHEREIEITWYGGEPLLALQTIEDMSAALSQRGLRFSADMLTNGYLATPRVADRLARLELFHIQVSMDGPRRLHNRSRSPSSDQDAFGRVMDGVVNLKKAGLNVTLRINVVEKPATLLELLECRDFEKMKDLEVPMYFAPLFNPGAYPVLEEIRKIGGRFLDAGFRVLPSHAKARHTGLAIAACSAQRDSDLFVGPKLELYECYTDFGHAERSVGNLRSGTIPLKRHYTEVPSPEGCYTCTAYALCQAEGCPSAVLKGTMVGHAGHCVRLKNEIEEHLRDLVKQRQQPPSHSSSVG